MIADTSPPDSDVYSPYPRDVQTYRPDDQNQDPTDVAVAVSPVVVEIAIQQPRVRAIRPIATDIQNTIFIVFSIRGRDNGKRTSQHRR